MMALNVAVLGVSASWASHMIRGQYREGNIVILHTFAILAATTISMLVLPLAYVTRTRSSIYGIVLAVLGLTLVINPWNDEALNMLMANFPEYSTYILSCWGFWCLGNWIGKRKRIPNTTPDGICQPADGLPKPSV